MKTLTFLEWGDLTDKQQKEVFNDRYHLEIKQMAGWLSKALKNNLLPQKIENIEKEFGKTVAQLFSEITLAHINFPEIVVYIYKSPELREWAEKVAKYFTENVLYLERNGQVWCTSIPNVK